MFRPARLLAVMTVIASIGTGCNHVAARRTPSTVSWVAPSPRPSAPLPAAVQTTAGTVASVALAPGSSAPLRAAVETTAGTVASLTPAPGSSAPPPSHDTEPNLPPPPAVEAIALPKGALASVIFKIPTLQPVVFLTIDDGWVRDPRVVAFIASQHLAPTVFLLTQAGRQDPSYFKALQAAGATIEDHTLTHPRLPSLSVVAQEQQICGAADDDARTYGTRPTLFRPPYGQQNRATQLAAAACGMKAVVQWTASIYQGQLTVVGGRRLKAGDIVILHFTSTLLTDLQAAVMASRASGLTVGRLESYLA